MRNTENPAPKREEIKLELFLEEEEEELIIEPPSFLDIKNLDWRELSPFLAAKAKRHYLDNTPLYFYGNYRRYLTLLLVGGALSLVGGLKIAEHYFPNYPLHFAILLSTIITGLGAAYLFLVQLRKRGIAIDKWGIYYWDEYRSLNAPWREVKGIYLQAVEAFFAPYPLCYVRVVLNSGDEFAFANFGPRLRKHKKVSFGLPPYPIVDIKDAELLLPILIEYSRWAESLPDLQQLRLQREVYSDGSDRDLEYYSPIATDTPLPQNPIGVGGWTLISTFFLKWLPQMGKVLTQAINPSFLGLSVGIYSLFFNWQFSLILVSILLFHEFGHVWAMYRRNMEIKGVYLIPFIGAATVTDDQWSSWNDMAAVSLAGPLWGTFLTGIFIILFLYTSHPIWLLAAVLNSLINLINLLPIQPLDGGRILYAIAYSTSSSKALSAPLFFLLLALLLSSLKGWLFLYILCFLGLLEFFREYQWRLKADKFICVPDALLLSPRDMVILRSLTSINFGLNNSQYLLRSEQRNLQKLRLFLTAEPMNNRQIMTSLLLSSGLFITLLTFLLGTVEIFPSYKWILSFFQ